MNSNRKALLASYEAAIKAENKARHNYQRYADHHGYAHRLTTALFDTYIDAMHARTQAMVDFHNITTNTIKGV